MKVGVSTACFHLKKETEDALREIKSSGADCTDVYLQTFYEYRPEFAKALAPDICGFETYSVRAFAPNFEAQLLSPSRRIRGDGYYWLDQIMRSAQLFGAKNYTFRGLSVKDSDSGLLGDISSFCERYGVRLCLENSASGLYDRPGVFGELKHRFSALCGALNLINAYKSGYPYTMYLKDMQGAISHVYLADADKNGNTCLPGRGVFDYGEIFKRLKGEGFDGALIIQADAFDDCDELKNSLEFVKEQVYKID